MPDIGEEHVADDEVDLSPGGLSHHPVPLFARLSGLNMSPLAVLHVTEVVPADSQLELALPPPLLSPEVQLLRDGLEQLYLVSPVVGIGGRGALRCGDLVAQDMVRPGQYSNLQGEQSR